jgi:hypothetical protein
VIYALSELQAWADLGSRPTTNENAGRVLPARAVDTATPAHA